MGRTSRSNPATYIGLFSDVRNLFSKVSEAKIRGYKANRFSFNVKIGRCETCERAGLRTIEMIFYPISKYTVKNVKANASTKKPWKFVTNESPSPMFCK